MLLGTGTDAALAANTGGAPACSAPTTSAPSTPALHLFPVTARSSNIAYKGPVYVKTASGQVIPYNPSSSTTTGTVASATGGSPPAASSQPAAVPPAGLGSA